MVVGMIVAFSVETHCWALQKLPLKKKASERNKKARYDFGSIDLPKRQKMISKKKERKAKQGIVTKHCTKRIAIIHVRLIFFLSSILCSFKFAS